MVSLKGSKKFPERSCNILSVVSFWWLNSLIYLGYKQPLKQEDLYDLPDDKKTKTTFDAFSRYWKPLETASIVIPMFKTFASSLILVALMKLTASLMMFVPAVMLERLLEWMVHREPFWVGFFYVALMFGASLVESIMNNQYEYYVCVIGIKMKSAVTDAVYQKALRLSADTKNKYTTGEIVNLMSVDSQKISDFILFLNVSWSSPLQVGIAIYLLWQQLGIATLAGVAVMFFLLPFNAWITSIWTKTQVHLMKKKDVRSKLVNEVLCGIKVIKLYGWEESFTGQIKSIRAEESVQLKKQSYYLAVVTFTLNATPIFVALFSFLTYALIDRANILTASKAFVSLALFNMIRTPLTMFPLFIQFAAMYFVACKRLNEYLNSEEADLDMVKHLKDNKSAISIHDGSFKWSRDPATPTALRNISIDFPHHKLIAVVGRIGSGKSSLLSSILGEMYKITGSVNVNGSLAYVPQAAWIQNATVKKNILFTSEYDKLKYQEVLAAAALEADLSILAAGDETEIGEKGINLSGGQKQRVSLARAVYADSDIYLLDDPLSAVDSHVGQHIFDQVIGPNGILKNKTRVLVTHKINLLPFVDSIIVMVDGKVSEAGTYHELLSRKGEFADFLIEHFAGAEDVDINLEGDDDLELLNEVKAIYPDLEQRISLRRSFIGSRKSGSVLESNNSPISINGSIKSAPRKRITTSISTIQPEIENEIEDIVAGKNLTGSESEITGGVTWTVYLEYFKSAGTCLSILCFTGGLVSNAFNIGSSLWLSEWSRDGDDPVKYNDTDLRNLRLGVYAALGMCEASFLFGSNLLVFLGVLHASSVLHNLMLQHVMRAPMSFFDTTPVGRVMNRFTKDVDSLDTGMRFNIRGFLTAFYKVTITIIIISMQTPYFLVVIVPLAIIYIIIQMFYVKTSRQLKRIESNTRSPMYTHFSETVTGSTSIKAFGADNTFISDFESRNDTNCKSVLLSIAATRWLAFRLEFIGNIVVVAAAILGITSEGDPATSGLSVSYALMVTAQLAMLIKGAAELENNLVAAERVIEYTKFEIEAQARIQETKPDRSWPQQGLVEFKDYSTRYRPGLELVLTNISFQSKPCEKIGIVGRTGAGKSSLTLALFRLIEPAYGKIIIDGVDVSTLGLLDLRTKLTIIPQDPVVFTGSLRMNLDPFQEETDEKIWDALQLAHLNQFVQTLDGGLDYEVAEGGENFSVGQRQLICLARALLRKSKILILDEATAAVDLETDALIQKTIQTEFANCTILTIAHRLNTILDYDRILVLDKKQVAEFDTVNNLLNDTTSIFYSMAQDAGLVGKNLQEEEETPKN